MTRRSKRLAGQRRDAQRGLTMVEILVTIVLSSLFFAAMLPVFVMASQQGQTDRARVVATNAAQSAIEILRDLPYDQLYDTNWNSPGAVASIVDPEWKGSGSGMDIGVVPYPSNSAKGQERYLLVSVRAWWTRKGGGVHDVTLKTAVYRQGLGTQTLVLYAYGSGVQGNRIIATDSGACIVAARLDAGDVFLTKRIDFEVWANNGTSIDSWSVYTREDDQDRINAGAEWAHQDPTDGYWYYEHDWTAPGVPDGTYTFIAKSVPEDPNDPDYDGDWTRKQYLLDRVIPEKATITSCTPGSKLETPEGPLKPTVSLEWTLAENIGDVGGVELYRTGTATDAAGVVTPLTPKTIVVSSITALAYVDHDVSASTADVTYEYTYKVLVKDLQMVEDPGTTSDNWSDPVSCTMPASVAGEAPKAPPSPLSATVSGRSVKLTWWPSPDKAVVDEYCIYRDAAMSVPIAAVETHRSTSSSQYSYTDPTVAYGGSYSYFVTAVSYGASPAFRWESWSIGVGPVQIPQPLSLSMRITLGMGTLPQGATKPTYARVAIHSIDTGSLIPANPWEYPTLKYKGGLTEWDTATKNPYQVTNLYEGSYEVIAMFYSQNNQRLGTYYEHVELTSLNTPVTVTYMGVN